MELVMLRRKLVSLRLKMDHAFMTDRDKMPEIRKLHHAIKKTEIDIAKHSSTVN